MTGDELERAIDFLLKSQATSEARIEQTSEQIANTNEQLRQLSERLDSFADTQANLIRVLTKHIETEDRINESLRAADVAQARFSANLAEALRAAEESRRAAEESRRASEESLRATMTELAARQGRTEATVERLSQKVEALVNIVEGQRGGG